MQLRSLFLPFFLFAYLGVQAQWSANWKNIPAEPDVDSVFLGPEVVLTNSLYGIASTGDTVRPPFVYNPANGFAKWEAPLVQKLILHFKTIPGLQTGKFMRKSSQLLNVPQLAAPQEYAPNSSSSTQLLGNISRSGSISRSITVGSSQDAVLRSNLNLRLNGNLGYNTTIQGVITDNNLPFQSGGFTQQLNEFDRVYLQIQNPEFGEVRAGDFDIGRDSSQFLQFQKRVTGAGYTGKFERWKFFGNGALAKGKFGRNSFLGTEGNQGPYPLTGINGERNIFIVSGSERVYIDGVQLTRGQDADYIIDYNTAQLTFTPLRPITREKRIVVEFQYSDRSYVRSTLYGGVAYAGSSWNFQTLLYSEQDSKNQPLQENLSTGQINQLTGTTLGTIRLSSIQYVPWEENRIFYSLRDSLGTDSVLVYQPLASDSAYVAVFSFLGTNQGDYLLDQNLGSGAVYRWVPRVNGQPQGQYAPVQTVQAPEQLQVFNQRMGFAQNGTRVDVEYGLSRRTSNLFSNRPDATKIGHALNVRAHQKVGNQGWYVGSHYEFVGADFSTVERLRNVEFNRDWNLSASSLQKEQHIGRAMVGFASKKISTQLVSEALAVGTTDKGFRQSAAINYQDSSWRINQVVRVLTSGDTAFRGTFWREQMRIQRHWNPSHWSGITSYGEWNKREALESNLPNSGYRFLEGNLYQGIGDSTKTYALASVFARRDDTVRTKDFVGSSTAWAMQAKGQWTSSKGGVLQGQITYRELERLDTALPDEKSVTSRIQYRQRWLRGFITSNTFYESSAGTEPIRTLSYVAVPAGTGTHTWEDYNANGIAELDEFRLASFSGEGNYLPIYQVGQQRLRTSETRFSQYILIQPEVLLHGNQAQWARWTSKFSLQLNAQRDVKSGLEGNVNQLNPFRESKDQVISQLESFRGSLFINRSSTAWGGEYSFQSSRAENLINAGLEGRNSQLHEAIARWWFTPNWGIKLNAKLDRTDQLSENFLSRNYRVLGQELLPELLFQWQTTWTSKLGVGMLQREQSGDGNTALRQYRLEAELRYQLASSWNVLAKGAFIGNDFRGNAASPLGFELLQGLQNGNNGTWQVGIQRQFGQGIVFSLEYQGRKSPDLNAVHTGSAQIKAFL